MFKYFLVFYVIALVAICYIILRPMLKAKKRYGSDEFLFRTNFNFVGGLNLPPNVPCEVIGLKSRIVMRASGLEISLPVEKIIDVSVMTTREIQKQYVANVGGAIAGAFLLGPLGAMLGGTSQRSISNRTKYLIFAYRDGEEIRYILFDVTNKVSNANQFKNRYAGAKRNTELKIEL